MPHVTAGGGEGEGETTAASAGTASGGRQPGTEQVLSSQAEENVVALETGRTSMIEGRPWPEVGELFQQSVVGGEQSGVGDGAGTSEDQRSAMEEGEEGGTVGGATASTVAASSSTASADAAASLPPTLQQLPDTIDREVLAALPDHIQQEVLAQHAREQRARQAQQEGFSTTISPEFLAALPPNIQEEVGTLLSVLLPEHSTSTLVVLLKNHT